jgi:hypothetical protein
MSHDELENTISSSGRRDDGLRFSRRLLQFACRIRGLYIFGTESILEMLECIKWEEQLLRSSSHAW